MVCKRCGNLLSENATVCDQCGTQVPARVREEGMAGRRQGRERGALGGRGGSVHPTAFAQQPAIQPTPRQEGAGKPHVRKGAPQPGEGAQRKRRASQELTKPVHRMMVNWAMVGAVLLVLLVMAAIGGYVFLKVTDTGQLILARMGRDADATALWTYGQELLDQGHVARSIATYEKALEMEPEREDLYARLTQLADAYEAAGRSADAERIYTQMYAQVDKENPYAYKEIMRLLEAQNRQLELSSFLKLAYENTKDAFFRRQREDLIPSTPTASEEAGTRKAEQDVKLISAEDYDIYYIFGDEGVLPEDGTLYTAPIHLEEGSYVIRAVAVSSDLISDEMRVQYTISLPTPMAPLSSLAPGEYSKRQRIWLRHVESEYEKNSKDAKLKQITIYYTIDGQTPTSNSPIFDGEPFYLPNGRTTLKAVSVNGYGKVSNILERTYKITLPVKDKRFGDTDEFADFTIMKTTRDQFVKRFGTPQSEKEIHDGTVAGNAVQLTYAWGFAKCVMTETGNVVYAYETNSSSAVGPRKSKLGMKEADVIALYRDIGQAHDQNGDRSLYFETGSMGKKYHLDKTHDRIDYLYAREDGGTVTLSYHLENGKVVKMSMTYRK